MNFGSNMVFIWVGCSGPSTKYPKAAGFQGRSEQEEALQQVQAGTHAALPLGPRDPVDPMVPDISMVHKEGVWSLCQVPPDKSQHGSLGFLETILPLPFHSDRPFFVPLLDIPHCLKSLVPCWIRGRSGQTKRFLILR